MARSAASRRRLFLDLDGVLADFDKRVRQLTGSQPDALTKKQLWSSISPPACPDFYTSLDFTVDGRELWAATAEWQPTVLTGLPMGTWAEAQKRAWVADRLGPHVRVICCMARDKHSYARPGDVLVDDRAETARAAWVAAGGVFVHHTSAAQSIAELRAIMAAEGPR
jgi:hypothetical protein